MKHIVIMRGKGGTGNGLNNICIRPYGVSPVLCREKEETITRM